MSDYAIKIPNQGRKKGNFSVFTRDNYLQLSLPTVLGYKRGTKVSMGLEDTEANRAKALAIAARMYSDLSNGVYKNDLSYYLSYQDDPNSNTTPTTKHTVTVEVAWETYLLYAEQELKPTTIKYAKYTIYPVLSHVIKSRLIDANKIYEGIKDHTTPGTVVRVLNFLSSLIKKYYPYLAIPDNPYDIVLKVAKRGIEKRPQKNTAKMIPSDEFNYALEVIGNDYPTYEYLLRFLWLTGCRPSEGAGLTWGAIQEDGIHIGNSITRDNGGWIKVEGSKTGRIRRFPYTPELTALIKKIPKEINPLDLVFLTKRGKPIDLTNFSRHIWKPIMPDYTLYHIRDSFITRQVEASIPLPRIAMWCDNSPTVIQKHYISEDTKFVPS